MKPELISPTADLERTKFALMYGADAVYGGLPLYSLRKAEVNFDWKSLKEAIDYVHKLGKKFYMTLNIFPRNKIIEQIKKDLPKIKKLNPDVLIISDPGLIKIIREKLPNIRIHLSTQANTLNYESVKFWQEQGVRRIILARELNLKEITEIHKRVPNIELESFVHGAMCISYSGRCLLSSFFTNREANQGLCTQPCRWKYKLVNRKQSTENKEYFLEEEKRPNEFIPIVENDEGTYLMNSKDLCLIEHLEDLVKAGVSSFKIEGRNKSEYYVGVVTRVYRKALNSIISNQLSVISKKKLLKELRKELETVSYRDYTTGFLFGKAKEEETFPKRAPIKKYNFVGVIRNYTKDGLAKIEVRNQIKIGDKLELVTPDEIKKFTLEELKTLDGKNIKTLSAGRINQKALIKIPYKVTINTLIREKN